VLDGLAYGTGLVVNAHNKLTNNSKLMSLSVMVIHLLTSKHPSLAGKCEEVAQQLQKLGWRKNLARSIDD
jgi:hypothetical protein